MDRWTAYAETWYIAFLRWYHVKHEYRCSFSYYNRFHRKLCEIFAIREQPRRLIFAPFVTRPIYDPFFFHEKCIKLTAKKDEGNKSSSRVQCKKCQNDALLKASRTVAVITFRGNLFLIFRRSRGKTWLRVIVTCSWREYRTTGTISDFRRNKYHV